MFANQYMAYEALSGGMKEILDSMIASPQPVVNSMEWVCFQDRQCIFCQEISWKFPDGFQKKFSQPASK